MHIKPEGRRPLVVPWHRRQDIKFKLTETQWKEVECI